MLFVCFRAGGIKHSHGKGEWGGDPNKGAVYEGRGEWLEMIQKLQKKKTHPKMCNCEQL